MSGRVLLRAAVLAALCAVPLVTDGYQQYIVNLVLVNIVVVTGLNFLLGYAGQFSFAHAALMGVGAYTTALLSERLGVSFWLSLPAAGVVAAAIGTLIALQAARLRRVYLALATVAFAETLLWILLNWRSVTFGTDGVSLPIPSFAGWDIDSDQRIFFVVLVCAALMWWLARRVVESHVGRAFIAIRENEILAMCSGVNVPLTKCVAFAVSAFYAGIGGGLFALVLGFIVPASFGLLTIITQFAAVVLGGPLNLVGGAIGAVLLTALPEVLRDFQSVQEVVYGLALLVCVVVMPRGIAGLLQRFGILPEEAKSRHWRALASDEPAPRPELPVLAREERP